MSQAVVKAAGLVVYRVLSGKVEFLLLQASYPPHHWTPPKGHVDPGEDEWTAALRETKEEANLNKEQLTIFEDCHETLHYMNHAHSPFDWWKLSGSGSRTKWGLMGEKSGLIRRMNEAKGKPKSVKYWLAQLKNPLDIQLSHEHQNSKWAELNDAIKIAEYPEMETLFRKFNEYILKH